MEKKRTIATDIAEIAQKLDGKVNFESIKFSQVIFDDKKELRQLRQIIQRRYPEFTPGLGTLLL